MKIAIFTDTFLPQTNGVVTATINLAKGLADRGHKIYIIAPRFSNSKEFKHKNICIKRIPSIPALFYEDFKFTSPINVKLLNFLREEKIELIHFTTPITIGFQSILISKILKVPLVGTFHTFFADPQYLKHAKLNFTPIQKFAWAYSRAFYNRCDLITSPSENTKKELLNHGFKRKIKVISNGIDLHVFDNSKWKQVKNKYNKEGDLLLFVGRVAHEKNIFFLLDCFKLVVDKIPKTKLIIVGSGPQMEEIKDKISSLGLSGRVILTGRIEYNHLVKSSIFKACDLFVTASVTENQPMTLLEAQANGLVSIGMNAKGIPNLIKHNYNGYLAQPHNKKEFVKFIIKLLEDRKLREKMSQNTLLEIKKHNLEYVITEWEKTYRSLIKKNDH